MPSKEYRRRLDDTGLEWIRVRFATEGGQVTAFTVQYETIIDDKPVPVVRFDTAHGFPHLDVLDRRGRVVEKTRLVHLPTLGHALTFAQEQIQDFWPRYREAFLGEKP
ncbi:MAG: DUF7718 family protein [Candidatus Binatia bacterium]